MTGGISKTRWQSVRRLLHARGRRAAGQLLVEGARAVEAACARPERIVSLLVGPEASPRSCEARSRLEAAGIAAEVLTREQAQALSSTAHSQDLFAVVRWAPAHRVRAAAPPFILHLSGLRDPSNVGALLRSAAAFRVPVTCSPDCADVTHPVAVRAGAASYFDLDLHVEVALADLQAHAPDHVVVSAAVRGGEPLDAFRWPGRTILVLGGEASGATESLAAAQRVTIPSAIESLNTAVAGGILLWAARSCPPAKENHV